MPGVSFVYVHFMIVSLEKQTKEVASTFTFGNIVALWTTMFKMITLHVVYVLQNIKLNSTMKKMMKKIKNRKKFAFWLMWETITLGF